MPGINVTLLKTTRVNGKRLKAGETAQVSKELYAELVELGCVAPKDSDTVTTTTELTGTFDGVVNNEPTGATPEKPVQDEKPAPKKTRARKKAGAK